MRFATLPNGTPDGRLHVVSRDNTRAAPCQAATTLQEALENWGPLQDALQAEYAALCQSGGAPFDPAAALAPCRARGSGWTPRPMTAMAS